MPVADRHGTGHRRRTPPDGSASISRSAKGEGTTVVLKKIPPRRSRSSERRWRIFRAELGANRRATRSKRAAAESGTVECAGAVEPSVGRASGASPRTRGHQPRRRRPVRRAGREGQYLRRADELKSRFLSNMSHEFRTPVNSIQAAVAVAARAHRRQSDRRTGASGVVHPQGGGRLVGAGQRPPRSRQGRSWQDRRPPN